MCGCLICINIQAGPKVTQPRKQLNISVTARANERIIVPQIKACWHFISLKGFPLFANKTFANYWRKSGGYIGENPVNFRQYWSKLNNIIKCTQMHELFGNETFRTNFSLRSSVADIRYHLQTWEKNDGVFGMTKSIKNWKNRVFVMKVA
jgi:hypothetical protein